MRAGLTGFVALIEEPELYLRPQAQRFLYRLLRRFAEAGNQVIYSTHSPAFLNAARLDEVIFFQRLPANNTHTQRAAPVTADQDFRVFSEFDAERSELLLRAALLVGGLTEKFVFAALGLDADREGVTIVECGGSEPSSSGLARHSRLTWPWRLAGTRPPLPHGATDREDAADGAVLGPRP